VAPAGSRLLSTPTRRCRLLQETADPEEIIQRLAALDIGKAEVDRSESAE
jgi:hypothetical protein